jgi:hypothetical protein
MSLITTGLIKHVDKILFTAVFKAMELSVTDCFNLSFVMFQIITV